MRRGGPGNRAAVLPIPPPQGLQAGDSSERSDNSGNSNRKPSPQKDVRGPSKPMMGEDQGVRAGPSFGPSGAKPQIGNRLPLGGRTSQVPGSSRSGQSSDRYASSASEIPDEMIRKVSQDSGSEHHSQEEDDDDDENEKLKKKRKMLKVYQQYMKSYPERYQDRKDYFQKVAESNVLSRFQKPTPETLVECGYNTEHQNARLKKLETASFILHFLGFFFTIGYYELNYNQIYEDYQVYLLYTLHGTSLYLCRLQLTKASPPTCATRSNSPCSRCASNSAEKSRCGRATRS